MATPFKVTPSPTYMHITDNIRGVLHKCQYTINERQGLSCVLGEFGLGKSTILRYLYADYGARDDVTVGLIATPIYPSAFALLKAICQEFKLEAARSFQAQMTVLEDFLTKQFKADKNTILFIDEAQILNTKQLELLRAILNFETNDEKLVQIILGSQLELELKLKHKRNLALRSRITTNSVLKPLTVEEIGEVVEARCKVSGEENPFTEAHYKELFKETKGVLRNVIKLCALCYSLKDTVGVDEIPVDWIHRFAPEAGI